MPSMELNTPQEIVFQICQSSYHDFRNIFYVGDDVLQRSACSGSHALQVRLRGRGSGFLEGSNGVEAQNAGVLMRQKEDQIFLEPCRLTCPCKSTSVAQAMKNTPGTEGSAHQAGVGRGA